jgi:hypothetical protein
MLKRERTNRSGRSPSLKNMKTYEDFEFSMPATREVAEYLQSKGYERRCGSFCYDSDIRSFYVLPFKKWYWASTVKANIHIEEIKEEVVKVIHTLKVTTK